MLSALRYGWLGAVDYARPQGQTNARRGLEPLSMLNTLRAFLLRSRVNSAVKAEEARQAAASSPLRKCSCIRLTVALASRLVKASITARCSRSESSIRPDFSRD